MSDFARLPLEDKIRHYAKAGHSRNAIAQLLGLSRYKLSAMLECMSDVQVARPHATKEWRASVSKDAYELTPARIDHLNRARSLRRHPLVEFCGKRLTRREVYRLWSEYVEITEEAFYRRLRQDRPLINALFDPKCDHAAAGRLRARTAGNYNTIYKERYDGRNRPV